MIVHAMPNAAASFLTHMADAAARALLLGCVAGLALKISRVKSVSVRLHVWRAVLGVALMMPLLGAFVPALSIKVPAGVGQRFEEFYKVPSGGGTVGDEVKHASHRVKPADVAQTADGEPAYANASSENLSLSAASVPSTAQGKCGDFAVRGKKWASDARDGLAENEPACYAVDDCGHGDLFADYAWFPVSLRGRIDSEYAAPARGAQHSRSTSAGARFNLCANGGN